MQCAFTAEEEVSGLKRLQLGHQRAAGWLGSCCWVGTHKCPKLSRVGHGKLVGRKELKQNREQHRDLKNLKVMGNEMNTSGGGSTLESGLYVLLPLGVASLQRATDFITWCFI